MAVSEGHYATQLKASLSARNAIEVQAFSGLVADWQTSWRQARDLQVRTKQLEKEAQELRDENETLTKLNAVNRASQDSSEHVAKLTARGKELQEELTAVYKDKGRMAEDLMQANRQLQVVRETNDRQGRELSEAADLAKKLKARLHSLTAQVDKERAAHAEASSELEARLQDKEAAEANAARLAQDNAELVNRLTNMRQTEAERMNEVNRVCEEMLANARHMQRAAALQTQQQAETLQRRTRSLRSPSLPERLRLDAADAGWQAGPARATQMPTTLLKRLPRHDGGAFTCAFDRAGNQLATAGADKVVRLWDAATCVETGALHGMQETVLECSFTTDARRLVAAGGDMRLRVWDLDSRREKHTMTGHSAKVCSVECSPVDASKAASGSPDRCIKLWDLNRGFNAGSMLCGSACNSVRYAQDVNVIISGHWDGGLRFWDVRSKRAANEVAGLHTSQICSVAVGRVTGQVLTAGKDNLLKLVDGHTFEVKQTLRAPGFTVGTVWCTACLSPDEQHAAAGSADGVVYVWQVQTGAVVQELGRGGGHQAVLASAWSPQGLPLVSCDKAGNVCLWRT